MERAEEDGVLASRVEVVEIAEAERLLDEGGGGVFSEGELRYARGRVDPGRRLAARLAAKRAAREVLGGDVTEADVEVERGDYGPPRLRLSSAGLERMRAVGATRVLVSLTHERAHAAALVLLVRQGR
ncbi:MAG TPA: hypothetical protein VMT70_22960 [Vicinamibacteria bacterium]|nr:hypothetical protein [Vicinamibacteria bacterium]